MSNRNMNTMKLEKVEDRLQVTFSGPFTPEAAKEAVDATAAACRREHCRKVLFDCRPMTGEIKVFDRFAVGEYGAFMVRSAIKVAMLGRKDQVLPDRFFETVVRNRGVNITVFTELDEANKWLASDEPPPP